ncbi:MAG: hypothetical protein GF328_13445, partial [Candidatus Latescibacteria bacterium]|nr:hypothetical protein [Candidatus Latescibacterota bacterium]
MSRRRPPDRLPDGYLPVWKCLVEADGRSSSRQALARRLGVATHTLQRLLVDGRVPRFPETTNPRVVHAWVRILARLAVHFDRDPRRWITGVGIAWNDRIARVSEAAVAGRAGWDRPTAGRAGWE